MECKTNMISSRKNDEENNTVTELDSVKKTLRKILSKIEELTNTSREVSKLLFR